MVTESRTPRHADAHYLAATTQDKPALKNAALRRPASTASGRAPIRTLLRRLVGAKPAVVDAMPPASFCDTELGLRSVVVAGHGGPTVVLEAGLGHGKRSWGSVFAMVSATARCVAYDRAGYGQSEPSGQSRDGLQIVHELRALLKAQRIAPPYLLVGHSLGGTYMKLFAKTYPEEVAGVVLVDARHSEFTQRCRQLGVPRLLYDPPELVLRGMAPTARAELKAAPLTLKQTRRAGPFPPVPLIVLTQRKSVARWPGGLGKVWTASQRDLAKMSSLGRLKICDDASHNVHMDRPEVVAQAILKVVRAVRYVNRRGRKQLV